MPTRTHGLARTPYYKAWCEVLRRIRNPNCAAYHNYGGRGLDIDPRWLTFEAFQADMGERPPGLTLERIDNDRGYWPDNCEWGTRKQQSHNTRRNVMITYQGQTMLQSEALKLAGMSSDSSSVIQRRVQSGMTNQQAFDDWLRCRADPSYRGRLSRENHHRVMVTYEGQTTPLYEALRAAGVGSSQIYLRIKRGMSHQEALDDWLQWKKRTAPTTARSNLQSNERNTTMPRKESPDQTYGPGSSIWATTDSRDLLFEIAKSEERSVKTVLRRALLDYAERSPDYQRFLSKQPKQPRPKAAA
jgi:hypothetical protein